MSSGHSSKSEANLEQILSRLVVSSWSITRVKLAEAVVRKEFQTLITEMALFFVESNQIDRTRCVG